MEQRFERVRRPEFHMVDGQAVLLSFLPLLAATCRTKPRGIRRATGFVERFGQPRSWRRWHSSRVFGDTLTNLAHK